MHRDEGTRPGLASAHRVEDEAVGTIAVEDRGDQPRWSAGSAASISPAVERDIRWTPVQRMLAATSIARIGSSQSRPVSATAPSPRRTPAEVRRR